MPTALDELMETASQALADLDYAECEALCLEALHQSREAGDWPYYRRIVLPLQEARRQKRQAALDGPIRLGVSQRPENLQSLLPAGEAGCVVLTRPCVAEDAIALEKLAAAAGQAVEVLLADNPADAAEWTVRSFHGPAVSTARPAPNPAWRDTWTLASQTKPPTPAHWFMQASEALGDAALASIRHPLGSVDRVIEIERLLLAAGDHELLHQALADAARAAHEAGA